MRTALALLVLLLAGCAITPPAFEPAASRRALVNWRHGAESLTADVIFQKDAGGGLRLVVNKGVTLFTLTRTGGEWTASGPMARGGWRGTWNTAPAALADWICLAEAWEGAPAAHDGVNDVRTGRLSVRYTKRGEKLSAMELVCAATGDRFRALF